MMKYEIYTSTEMEGLWGDHNNGDGGWDSLDLVTLDIRWRIIIIAKGTHKFEYVGF